MGMDERQATQDQLGDPITLFPLSFRTGFVGVPVREPAAAVESGFRWMFWMRYCNQNTHPHLTSLLLRLCYWEWHATQDNLS
jgi:hypothetical protein